MEQFKKKFIEEANDHLTNIEHELLALEENEAASNIEEIFRPLHTLKGASSMFGFSNIEQVTHQLESTYDEIRSGKRKLQKPLIDLTFKTVDHIRKLLDDDEFVIEENINNHTIILNAISKLIGEESKITKDNSEDDAKITSTLFYTSQILIKPQIHPDDRGLDMTIIFDDLKNLGDCIVFEKNLNPSKKISIPLWEIYLATNKPVAEIEEVLLFLEGEYEMHKLIDENIIKQAWFVESVSAIDKKEIYNLVDLKYLINSNFVDDVPEIKQKASKTNEKVSNANQSIRVSAEKLDRLMNLVSELVTTKAELELAVQIKDEDRLEEITEKIDKLAKQFRDNALDIRLVPIANIMIDFKRLIRDMSGELGKQVVFEQIGTDTELDKNIIESLKNPLMHIIRNSLDHGLETPEIRRLFGKTKEGCIIFKAYQLGNSAIIEISDDGKGIDTKLVLDKAIAKGIVSQDVVLSEKEIFDLIFIPGFSTAQKITEVSGRGVGMDVVMKMINNLSGSIEIESKPNQGTKFIIKLPLTLSIIDTLMIKSNNIAFLIPLAQVETCTNFKDNKMATSAQDMVLVDNVAVPVLHLKKIFKMPIGNDAKEKVIILRSGNQQTGLVVDEVIGEHQAVLRPLGEIFKNQKFLSGGSILGDGSVALVLDASKLINETSKRTISVK